MPRLVARNASSIFMSKTVSGDGELWIEVVRFTQRLSRWNHALSERSSISLQQRAQRNQRIATLREFSFQQCELTSKGKGHLWIPQMCDRINRFSLTPPACFPLHAAHDDEGSDCLALCLFGNINPIKAAWLCFRKQFFRVRELHNRGPNYTLGSLNKFLFCSLLLKIRSYIIVSFPTHHTEGA